MRKLAIILLAATLVGCSGGPRDNEIVGTGVGAALGGLLGSQIGGGSGQLAATAGLAVLGGILGNHVGRTMDRVDAQRMSSTFETAPSNRAVNWNNPDTGYQHQVVTQPATYPRYNRGQPCREFTHTATIGGRPEQVYGTACRQADGSWKVTQ